MSFHKKGSLASGSPPNRIRNYMATYIPTDQAYILLDNIRVHRSGKTVANACKLDYKVSFPQGDPTFDGIGVRKGGIWGQSEEAYRGEDDPAYDRMKYDASIPWMEDLWLVLPWMKPVQIRGIPTTRYHYCHHQVRKTDDGLRWVVWKDAEVIHKEQKAVLKTLIADVNKPQQNSIQNLQHSLAIVNRNPAHGMVSASQRR